MLIGVLKLLSVLVMEGVRRYGREVVSVFRGSEFDVMFVLLQFISVAKFVPIDSSLKAGHINMRSTQKNESSDKNILYKMDYLTLAVPRKPKVIESCDKNVL